MTTKDTSSIMEKVVSALLPILFACVVYLMNTLSSLGEQVTILNSKISLVVTADNKQATNTGAELAREKLRQDLSAEIQKNRDMIMEGQKDVAIINEKIKTLK